jgi:hypothetical protein
MAIAAGHEMKADDMLDLTFFPIGTVLMFDGSGWQDNDTLKGWYACTTANAAAGRTPDLTNKFIRGKVNGATAANYSKASYDINLASNNYKYMPQHSHSLTGVFVSRSGSHTHQISVNIDGWPDDWVDDGHKYWTSSTGFSDDNPSTSSNGKHIHSLPGNYNFSNAGQAGAASFSVLPANYSVIFIKRVKAA